MKNELADAKKAATAAANEQQAMEMEIGRCLLGQSRFTEEQLSTSITAAANLRATPHKYLFDNKRESLAEKLIGIPFKISAYAH